MQLGAVQNHLYACHVLFKVTVHCKDRIQVMQSYPLQDPDAKLLKTFFSSYCIWLIGRHSRLLHWQISICLWACHLSDQQVADSCLCFSTHLNLISQFFVHLSLLFTFTYYKAKMQFKIKFNFLTMYKKPMHPWNNIPQYSADVFLLQKAHFISGILHITLECITI